MWSNLVRRAYPKLWAPGRASPRRQPTQLHTPHVWAGDIGNPQAMQSKLERRFGAARDAFLHVRSFLDHDRPFIPPVRPCTTSIEVALNSSSDGVYVDGKGELILPSTCFRSAVEHVSSSGIWW